MPTETRDGLLACPHCGSAPALLQCFGDSPWPWEVECSDLDCRVVPSVGGRSERQARGKWNARACKTFAAPATPEAVPHG